MRFALFHSARDFFKRSLEYLRLREQVARASQKAAPLPNPDFFRIFKYALKLHREASYTPEEAYRHGMLDPARSGESFQNFISKNGMKKVQRSLNPGSWTRVIEDKSIFYKYCMALGVPIPGLYALFFRGRAGWSQSGSGLRNRDDWVEHLRNDLPEELVIKPAWGVYGCGVRVFSRQTPEVYTDANGLQLGPEAIYDTVLMDARYQSMIIQERLKNHHELVQLSGTPYLQTVRIVTFIDGSNNCNIIYAFFKPIVGGNFVDNHDHGRTGNLHASIDLKTGMLIGANTRTMDGSGLKTVPMHPVTGKLFEGFQMPLWKETCQLATETAYNFLPLRIVGWDIAITPNGPCLIEGNAWADPNDFEGAGKILASLRIE